MSSTTASAETPKLPPIECLDPERDQLYNVDPPWFSEKASIGAKNFNVVHAAALRQLADIYKDFGIRLVTVPQIPAASFAPDPIDIGGPFDSRELLLKHSQLVYDYFNAGTDILDIYPATVDFPDETTFHRRTDHHWSEEGAARSAQYVSSQLFDTEFPSIDVWYDEFSGFSFEKSPHIPPIMRTIVGPKCFPRQFAIDKRIVAFPSAEGGADLTEDSLFGADPEEKIVVIGTSYSAAGVGYVFPRALEYYSGKPVVNYSIAGGGTASALISSLTDELHLEPSIKTAVWLPAPSNQLPAYSGAAILAAGVLTGPCSKEKPNYSEPVISTEYGDWFDISELALSSAKFDVFARHDERISLKITLFDEKPVPVEISFGRQHRLDEPFVWPLKLPFDSLAGIEKTSVEKVMMRLVSSEDISEGGPIDIKIAACGSL